MSTPQQMIVQTAVNMGVDPNLALAVAQQESGFNQAAKGAAGEIGVFQLMPSTAADLGVNPFDLQSNITGGITYLKQQLVAFGGDPAYALMAYNAGPTAVKSGAIPASSIDYANSILSNVPVTDTNISSDALFSSTGSAFSTNDLSGFDPTWLLIAAAVMVVVGMEG